VDGIKEFIPVSTKIALKPELAFYEKTLTIANIQGQNHKP